jgi:hypothetical protein
MNRVIGVIVFVTAIAWIISPAVAFAGILTANDFRVSATTWLIMVAATTIAGIIGWFLVSRSIRAWRQPTPRHIRDLHAAFVFVVFVGTYGVAEPRIASANDVLDLTGPWIVAFAVAAAAHFMLRRWDRSSAGGDRGHTALPDSLTEAR